MKHILVTGGTGFIGSHTCIRLIEYGYKITIIDSNVNSTNDCLRGVRKVLIQGNYELSNLIDFKKGDIRDKNFLINVFTNAQSSQNPIDAVIHFAGLKAVGESVENPLLYWENNVHGSISLLQVMEDFNCKVIVFSSSATIYGDIGNILLDETLQINPNNPYGQTKASVEYILDNVYHASKKNWKIASLRYFNPIGAHQSGLIGEDPLNRPNNLFPLICRVAQGLYKEIKIFGSDWPTYDGTGVRDYIHVMDLADAHCEALKYLFMNSSQNITLNIGTGIGTSVLNLINKFVEINKCKVPYSFCERRLGDVPFLVANNKKALSTLNWKPKRTIEDMCKDGWRWQRKHS